MLTLLSLLTFALFLFGSTTASAHTLRARSSHLAAHIEHVGHHAEPSLGKEKRALNGLSQLIDFVKRPADTVVNTVSNVLDGPSSSQSSTSQSSTSDSNSCPAVWSTIAADLKLAFAGCNNNAASAVRFGFHDAAGYSSKNTPYAPASGGADGSLLLNDDEIARGQENPLQAFRAFLKAKYNLYKGQGVSAADFVQFAASVGVRSCPGGPVVKTVVGRKDDSNAAPDGNLPDAFGAGASHDVLIQLWADKGISPRELGALMGAHSISRAFAQQANGLRPGSSQDSTPRQWDTEYFNQTQAQYPPRGVGRFESDVNLGKPGTACGAAFTEFGGNADAWSKAYSDAAFKMSVMGIPDNEVNGFVDCTKLIS